MQRCRYPLRTSPPDSRPRQQDSFSVKSRSRPTGGLFLKVKVNRKHFNVHVKVNVKVTVKVNVRVNVKVNIKVNLMVNVKVNVIVKVNLKVKVMAIVNSVSRGQGKMTIKLFFLVRYIYGMEVLVLRTGAVVYRRKYACTDKVMSKGQFAPIS